MTSEAQSDSPPVLLDHVAIATRRLSDGSELFGGLLEGLGAHTGDSLGFRWRQCAFPAGPKIEVLTPTDPVDGAFLERFLARSGAGPHHYNFEVPDLVRTLDEVAGLGITPVQVRLGDPHYKEAFLRPGEAHGIVVQIVQHQAPTRRERTRASTAHRSLAHVACIEHHVADLPAAIGLFTGPLGGRVDQADPSRPGTAEVTWPDQGRIRLVESTAVGTGGRHPAGFLDHLEFARAGQPFSPADRAAIEAAADRLGVTLRLAEARPTERGGLVPDH
jgi:catechol 2,3-dioxygenase-like lactoylglutathione lyase family enzyme